MSISWVSSNNNYYKRETANTQGHLEKGVYVVKIDQDGTLYLSGVDTTLTLPNKIYDIHSNFINRVCLSVKENISTGVLLYGLKGTSKTITLKLIANRCIEEYDMPVILVTGHFNTIDQFVQDISQDICVVFDEFEKTHSKKEDKQNKLLSLFDGVSNTLHKRLWLLTSNSLNIDENLISRPSRIRYLMKFSDLSKEIIIEIIDDLLLPSLVNYRESLIKVINSFNLVSIDNITSFIKEVNQQRQDPEDLIKDFNIDVKPNQYMVHVTEVVYKDGFFLDIQTQPFVLNNIVNTGETLEEYYYKTNIGGSVYANAKYLGQSHTPLSPTELIVRRVFDSDDYEINTKFTEDEDITITEDNISAVIFGKQDNVNEITKYYRVKCYEMHLLQGRRF